MSNGLLNKVFGWTDPKEGFGMAQAKPEGAQVQYDAMRNAMDLQLKQAQLNAMQNAVWVSTESGMSGGSLSGQLWSKQTVRDPNTVPLPLLSMKDLDSPAGKVSLEELSDLWRARWGAEWVKRGEITDEFYTCAAKRLLSTARLEGHELADGTHVYRLIER